MQTSESTKENIGEKLHDIDMGKQLLMCNQKYKQQKKIDKLIISS